MLKRSGLVGLTAVLLVSTTAAQPPPGFGPPGFGAPGAFDASPLSLARMPEVQKELGIDGKQKKALDELLGDLQKQMQASFAAAFKDGQELSEEERREHFEKARKRGEEISKKAEEKLNALLDGKQRERLGQLRLQREGVAALSHPEVAKKLGLSDEQQRKLDRIRKEANGPGPFPRPEERRKMEAGLLAVLSAEQKAKWADLKGKTFTFPAPRGFGPPGFMGQQQRKLVKQFDKDSDGRLNKEERQAARASLKKEGPGPRGFGPPGRGPGGPPGGPPPGGPPWGRGRQEPARPGPHVTPAEVKSYPRAGLYEPTILRTLFLEFENKDWEAELADFHNTDVEVPCTLTVDGKKYPNVGVHFRGMSSYGMVSPGYKRSFNLSLDFADRKQRLYGYKTLNLLNSHEDSSFLSTVLYSHIARQYIPAPKANFVKVVINGESWGVYVNAQQLNKDFLAENYSTSKGVRWKVRGSPGGRGGLDYAGDRVEEYKRRYQIKSKDTDRAWKDLIRLCRTLQETPLDQLEKALEPMLDIDGVLWFLALDNALINNDGYWIRASDYSLYQDPRGMFHVIPHDMNEAFRGAMGFGFGGPGFGPGGPGRGGPGRPGGPGGPGGRPRGPGVDLDPLVGMNEAHKPLRSRLLAVPALRARYLDHVRTLAAEALDWNKLGPVVKQYQELIEREVEADTRKLTSYEAFKKAVSPTVEAAAPRGRPEMSLRAFAEQRRRYLLERVAELKKEAK